MLAASVLLANVVVSEAATPPQSDETTHLVQQGDAEYRHLVLSIPELIGASLIAARDGVPRQIVFRTTTVQHLTALANVLLERNDSRLDASLWADESRAKAFSDNTTKYASVLQHRVGDTDVLGSIVIIKLRNDGSGEITNALIPVSADPKVILAPGKAVTAAEHSVSMSRLAPAGGISLGDVSGDKYFVRGENGKARLAYKAKVVGGAKKNDDVYLDVENGDVLDTVKHIVRFDSAPDDYLWTNPPMTYTGTVIATGLKVYCTATPAPMSTNYYADIPYLLKPPRYQLNVGGPAERFRIPSIGLTSILLWPGTIDDLTDALPSWSWSDLALRIFQTPICTADQGGPDAVFDSPMGFSELSYTHSEAWQQLELQTAIEDINERFGWHGLDNEFNPLLFAQNANEPGEASCLTDVLANSYKFKIIYCPIDLNYFQQTGTQRIAPVETFAHEFAHTIIFDKGLTNNFNTGKLATAEAIADIFGVYERSLHTASSPWALGDQAPYIQRLSEWRCKYDDPGYCSYTPPANRDIAHPKADLLVESPIFYGGPKYWGMDVNRASEVISYMLYAFSEGLPKGYRDDDANNGGYDAFSGVGLSNMLEVFYASLDGLPLVEANAGSPMHEYASQLNMAAAKQCGIWSTEEMVTGKAAWIVNLSNVDVDLAEPGYQYPELGQQSVSPMASFQFKGAPGSAYEYQVSPTASFGLGMLIGKGIVDENGIGKFLLKLDSNQSYWWRVRWAAAPMLSAPHADKDLACWRPASHFSTGNPATVSDVNPVAGDNVEPWLGQLSWTSGDWDGFEWWVDDNKEPRYQKFWVHRQLLMKDYVPYKESQDPKSLQVQPGTASLPQSHDLCWKIVGFKFDENGNRIDGDPIEQCFHTKAAETTVSYPPPPDSNGVLAKVSGQPLSIDYDPAAGAHHHDFSLAVIKLGGGSNPPDPVGEWAYIDDPAHDINNTVKESPSAQDWTSRTRKRMLPVELNASAYLTHSVDTVRLTVKSYSPAISSPANGGTYPEKFESTEPAVVDFRPVAPDVHLAPSIFTPPAMNHCSSNQNTDLKVAWNHGADATQTLVPEYRLKLYPEHCGNRSSPLCSTVADKNSPDFEASLALQRDVKNNGGNSQELEFSRSELFPDEEADEKQVTGYLVHLFGASGPEPGPPGLNITGDFEVDLPVMPAVLDAVVAFSDGGPLPETAHFEASSQANKNAANPLWGSTYNDDYNHTIVQTFKGPGCVAGTELLSDSSVFLYLNETPELANDPHPVVSAQAELNWGYVCPIKKSACVTQHGSNPNGVPDPVTGLMPQEQTGQLGASWDPPNSDPNPSSIQYRVSVTGANADNILVHNPGNPGELANPVTVTLPNAAAFGSQIGIPVLAPLVDADLGKYVELSIQACRNADTSKCSAPSSITYQIGSAINNATNPPNPPQDVAMHFGDPAAQQAFQDAFGIDPGPLAMWINVSWNPPSSGPAPVYYLVSFGAGGSVPGVLPTWFNTLGISGVSYPGSPTSYTAVVRASESGVAIGGTAWARYVWPLAQTFLADAPASGTLLSASVMACAGAAPLPAGKNYDWVVGVSGDSCSVVAPVSQAYP